MVVSPCHKQKRNLVRRTLRAGAFVLISPGSLTSVGHLTNAPETSQMTANLR